MSSIPIKYGGSTATPWIIFSLAGLPQLSVRFCYPSAILHSLHAGDRSSQAVKDSSGSLPRSAATSPTQEAEKCTFAASTGMQNPQHNRSPLKRELACV